MTSSTIANRWARLAAVGVVAAAMIAPAPAPMARAAGEGYVSLPAPARLLDTRADGSTVDDQFEAGGMRPYGSTLALTAAGRAGVPADAATVVLNITVTEPIGGGFITVFPCGTSRPMASNVNYVAGETVANLVLARVGTEGAVCLFNSGATHLVVDVAGSLPSTDAFTPLDAPARLLDTRADGTTVDGTAAGDGVRPAGSSTPLTVGGRASVPQGVDGVVLNVTVDDPETAGFVTVYACDASLPTASNVNYVAGETAANAVVTKLTAAGEVCLHTSATAHLVVDISGYFADATTFVPLQSPARLLDSRADGTTVDGEFRGSGVRPTGSTTALEVAGRAGVPTSASAVVLNVTVDRAEAAGFVTVHPPGGGRPNASNVNYTLGQTVPNAVIARVGGDGTVCLFNSGATHLVVDVAGYMTGPPSTGTATPCTAAGPPGGPGEPAPSLDWRGYLNGPAHSSAIHGDPAISPTAVARLTPRWTFTAGPAAQPGAPGPKFDSSPIVVDGRVFIGSRTGIFSALDAATGAVLWDKQLDWGSAALCPAKGIIGTAAAAPDPVTGAMTVYAPGANYLYALDAATGAERWRVPIGPSSADLADRWYNYSSPTVIGGRIYMGLASNCNDIKIRGGVVQLDQASGQLLGTYYAVPAGQVGLSVWTSVAGDGQSVWVTTGNPGPNATAVYDAFSIVRLSAATMAKQEKWTAPIPITEDLDMGGSPTLFGGTVAGAPVDLVGACNKNGIYYAWLRNELAAGPVWQRRVGNPGGGGNGACITSAAYDRSSSVLYVAGNETTVDGVAVQGSLRALDASTGTLLWERPLACMPNGSPTLNATTHVVAVPMYTCLGTDQPGVALFDGLTGEPLRTITTAGKVFAQPVFASGKLFVADGSGHLIAYGLPS